MPLTEITIVPVLEQHTPLVCSHCRARIIAPPYWYLRVIAFAEHLAGKKCVLCSLSKPESCDCHAQTPLAFKIKDEAEGIIQEIESTPEYWSGKGLELTLAIIQQTPAP